MPILVPLFVSAFRRADELAVAMEARCYRGGKGRTRLKQLVYERRDVITYTAMFIMITVLWGSRYFPLTCFRHGFGMSTPQDSGIVRYRLEVSYKGRHTQATRNRTPIRSGAGAA